MVKYKLNTSVLNDVKLANGLTDFEIYRGAELSTKTYYGLLKGEGVSASVAGRLSKALEIEPRHLFKEA